MIGVEKLLYIGHYVGTSSWWISVGDNMLPAITCCVREADT